MNLSICAHRHGNHIKIIYKFYASNKNWLLGLRPRPRWGSLQHSPIPPSWAAGGHPSRTFPRRVFLNFIQILHLAVCTLPYIHVLSWLRHCMVESTYNMLCTPPTHNLATGLSHMGCIDLSCAFQTTRRLRRCVCLLKLCSTNSKTI